MLGVRKAKSVHALGLNPVHDPHFARLLVGVGLGSKILFRHSVEMLVGGRPRHFHRTATNLEISVRIAGIRDDQRHACVMANILVLVATLGRVDDDGIAVGIAPNRSHLRRTVGTQGAQAAISFSFAMLISLLSGAAWDMAGAVYAALIPIFLGTLPISILAPTLVLGTTEPSCRSSRRDPH